MNVAKTVRQQIPCIPSEIFMLKYDSTDRKLIIVKNVHTQHESLIKVIPQDNHFDENNRKSHALNTIWSFTFDPDVFLGKHTSIK